MKVVQTKLSNIEYNLLKRYAESKGITIKDALREIIKKCVLDDKTYNDDPIFKLPPSVKSKGIIDRGSIEHNKYLYGEE